MFGDEEYYPKMLITLHAVLTGQKMLRDHWPAASDAFSILKRCYFLLYFHEFHFFFFPVPLSLKARCLLWEEVMGRDNGICISC